MATPKTTTIVATECTVASSAELSIASARIACAAIKMANESAVMSLTLGSIAYIVCGINRPSIAFVFIYCELFRAQTLISVEI
jgi:hypothetical protein